MRGNGRLKGRRVAVLAADGFESVELQVPVAALRWAGAHVDVVSLRHGRIRGVNLHEPARRAFVRGMLALFTRSAPHPPPGAQPARSAPQRDDPPGLVLAAMRWLPRPSIRALAGLAVVGIWALNRSRSRALARLDTAPHGEA
jgi:putative intracellular protease/amidase